MNLRICIPYYKEYEWAEDSWPDLTAGISGRVECYPRRGQPHICWARNDLINDFSITGSIRPLSRSHFLFQDSDIRCNGSEVLIRLLEHDVDIVGAKYKMHFSDDCYAWRDGQVLPWSTRGFQEVDEIGTGLLLIKGHVFTRMIPPWFYMPPDGYQVLSEDQCFSRNARKAGFKIYLDADLEVEHKPI